MGIATYIWTPGAGVQVLSEHCKGFEVYSFSFKNLPIILKYEVSVFHKTISDSKTKIEKFGPPLIPNHNVKNQYSYFHSWSLLCFGKEKACPSEADVLGYKYYNAKIVTLPEGGSDPQCLTPSWLSSLQSSSAFPKGETKWVKLAVEPKFNLLPLLKFTVDTKYYGLENSCLHLHYEQHRWG